MDDDRRGWNVIEDVWARRCSDVVGAAHGEAPSGQAVSHVDFLFFFFSFFGDPHRS